MLPKLGYLRRSLLSCSKRRTRAATSAALSTVVKTTPFRERYVRMEGSKFDPNVATYPTPGRGHEFKMNIFGLLFSTEDINSLQDVIWNNESFLPTESASAFSAGSVLKDLSDIGQGMAVRLEDNVTPGLLATNMLRATVMSKLSNKHFLACMELIKSFKYEKDPAKRRVFGKQISDVAFWSQWVIRGFLFEGKLNFEVYCSDHIPEVLAKMAFASNAALGRHQIEFVYDDYTLKAAIFPKDIDFDTINYDDPKAILDAIAAIKTPVGFNDMKGGMPEHNFRHNHSLMEFQMRRAFQGVAKVLEGDKKGWDLIVEAARRANKIFKTMLMNTPPDSYPRIRLPIKGVRGGCGSVYHPHGVFYEGVGANTYTTKDGKVLNGVYINNEWGQTGANSSMYKYLDILIGVAQMRQAFTNDPVIISKMKAVYDGSLDSGELGTNPIDSMQRAFDLFTRPTKHMRMLIDTEKAIRESKILENDDPEILLQRLRLAYWVAEHRITHGQYVLKAIYQTEPVGGQSRADGTGGSTPPFLKLFLDQTLAPGRSLLIKLLMKGEDLQAEYKEEVKSMSQSFDKFEERMSSIRDKGLQLEFEEKGFGKN